MSGQLGGKTFAELKMKVLRITKLPILSSTRDKTKQVGGRHGLYHFGTTLAEKPITLECAMVASTAYELQQAVNALADHLTDGRGVPKEMDLIWDIEPYKVYKVRYAGNAPLPELVHALGTFTLPLVAYDPFASFRYEAGSITLDSEIFLDRDDIRLGDAYTFDVAAAGSVEVNNFGNLNIRPIIEVTGSFTTLSLTVNGKTFGYTEALAAQTLIIDGEQYKVRIGSVNKLSKKTGDFLELIPGINTVTIGGMGLNCSISFRFHPKFK